MKFWKRGLALVLAVSACFTLLTACGQAEPVGDQLALAVCIGETPATYDPIYAEEPGEQTILIPGREGSLGIGRANIQSAIERAVGADIL